MKRDDINRACAFCEHARKLSVQDEYLCGLRGVVAGGHLCRKFVYDPLKREPPKSAEVRFDPVDISDLR